MPNLDLDRLIAGWRGPLLAALVALLASLPGLIATPPIDRTEARFAQATVQMIEDGDFAYPRFQERPASNLSPAAHWLQAIATGTFSSVEARDIWSYRLPSLLAAMIAAAACAWGAASLWGQREGVAAGIVLASSFLMSTEGFIAKADALLVACVTVAMAALARLYAMHRHGFPMQRRWKLVLWVALALSLVMKGPIGLLIFALTVLTLSVWDRKWRWVGQLGWGWGLVIVLAAVGPWALAATVASDGEYWGAVGKQVWRGLGGEGERLAPPGAHALLTILLFFPGTLLLVAAAIAGWTRRNETGVRFALAWLVPAWLLFELTPGKLPHYVLPLYPALAWLVAAALTQNLSRIGLWGGTVLSGLAALLWSMACLWLLARYGNASDPIYATIAIGCLTVGVFVGVWFMAHREVTTALMITCAAGVLAHAAMSAGLVPNLKRLWPSEHVVRVLDRTGLEPRKGLAPGPVAVAGFNAPSLVFLLGSETQVGGPEVAVRAVAEGRPAIVERRVADSFQLALADRGLKAEPTAEIRGYDYARARPIRLIVYRPRPPEGAVR